MRILGVCLAMYQCTRSVQVGIASASGVVTSCGVAAGCTMATFLIRAYLLRDLQQFVKEHFSEISYGMLADVAEEVCC